MTDTVTDFVCTRCIRELNLTPILREEESYVTRCNRCDNEQRRCCFYLQRSIYDHPVLDKTCYNDYLRYKFPENKHFYFNKLTVSYQKAMWKNGVEYELGITLCFICNMMGYIPREIIKLIYEKARKIRKWLWRY